jgi:hypothetical protein
MRKMMKTPVSWLCHAYAGYLEWNLGTACAAPWDFLFWAQYGKCAWWNAYCQHYLNIDLYGTVDELSY